jgi:hypothetical protein
VELCGAMWSYVELCSDHFPAGLNNYATMAR